MGFLFGFTIGIVVGAIGMAGILIHTYFNHRKLR